MAAAKPRQTPTGSARNSTIAILMYHHIDDGESEAELEGDPIYDPLYTVPLDRFRVQMAFLEREGIEAWSFARLLERREATSSLPKRVAVVTFDDGNASNAHCALPVLQRHGFGASFFLTVEHLGRPGYLSWDAAQDLVDAGMEVGSHLVHHVLLNDLDLVTARRELAESRAVLGDRLGVPIDVLAPPGGRLTKEVEHLAREVGYRAICGSSVGFHRLGEPRPFVWRRIPITQSTGLSRFQAIVMARPGVLWPYQVRSRVLNVAKRLLGNRRYDALRGRVLGRQRAG